MTLLTEREHAVLVGVANGSSYRDLARQWGIEEITVRVYGHRALAKFGATSMAHAVLLACRAGLLDGKPRRHGDHAGFAAHVYRGEDPWACTQGCPEGERAYRAERRRARREAKAAAA